MSTATRLLTAAAILLCSTAPAPGATLPAGFSETIVSGLTQPTAMAIAPDGRIFVCLQAGSLRVIKNGALLPTPFLTLSVSSSGERGLLGVTFHPNFPNSPYVYVYYTTSTSPIHNRISRFTAAGDVAVPGSEVIILELNNLTSATNHNGGAIHFGLDGKLYAAVGENATQSNSQTLSNLLGKMLRINRDGTIPDDNPFYDTASGVNRAIWALGLRNPFTFSIHPFSGRMFINDVGAGTAEEINDGIAGSNYGWPTREGSPGAPDPRFRDPVFDYAHGSTSTTGCAITGGAFYAPHIRQFPASFFERYFFADFCSSWIRTLHTSTYTPADFASAALAPVDLAVAGDGTLYYLSRGSGGFLGRIIWSQHLEGNVNSDGATNSGDVFYLINRLHGGGPPPVQGGDVDGNNVVNANDLTYLVNYLFGGGPTPL